MFAVRCVEWSVVGLCGRPGCWGAASEDAADVLRKHACKVGNSPGEFLESNDLGKLPFGLDAEEVPLKRKRCQLPLQLPRSAQVETEKKSGGAEEASKEERSAGPCLVISLEFGMMPTAERAAVWAEWAARLRCHSQGSEAWEKCLKAYAADPAVERWVTQAVETLCSFALVFQASEVTLAAELSCQSATPGRVHWHAVLSWVKRLTSGGRAWRELSASASVKVRGLHLFGLAPNVNRGCSAKGRHALASAQRAHAYLQIMKLGGMRLWTNWAKGSDFVCQSRWVVQWWQLNKLSSTVAKEELLLNRDNCEKAIAMIQHWEAAMYERTYRREQADVKRRLAASFKRFKTYPIVELFVRLHAVDPESAQPPARFPFLVLVGESCTGKTQFAMALFGRETTYYINVQSADEPNLKDFVRHEHTAILMDEASPKFVVRHKALFQANVEGVQLQESKCQQYSTWRFLYGTPIIICTNRFNILEVSPEDRLWLQSNMMLLNIGNSPTYEM